MKNNIKNKKFSISIFLFLIFVLFSNNVLADDLTVNISDKYKEWLNYSASEKQEVLMPQTIYGKVPSLNSLDSSDTSLNSSFKDTILNSASISSSRYVLSDYMNLRVEDQQRTTECWAFSSIKSLETNIALRSGSKTLKNFSERHMDYATSRTFLDGINSYGFYRDVEMGGLPSIAYTYLTNGTGAVLESDMPFENNHDLISLSEINKDVNTVVTDYSILPSIIKDYTYDSNGNTASVKYLDSVGNEYSNEELTEARNLIKNHLVKYGAISSITVTNADYFDTSDYSRARSYNCNDVNAKRDHAITIIGWDDNYSRDNFKEGRKPSTDGAYIVLNSYGTQYFNNGIFYISYEDYYIESELYGVQKSTIKDYDNIYQYDFYGPIFEVGTNMKKGFIGATYTKSSSNDEYISSVGVTLADYSKIEVYINPNGDSLNMNDLVLVSSSDVYLSSGYHRVDIDPIKINSNSFAVAIKIVSSNNKFSYLVEAKIDDSVYANVTSSGRSYLSTNGYSWGNLSNYHSNTVDLSSSDVCIKVFTTNGLNNNSKQEESKDDEDNSNNENTNPLNTSISSNIYKIENGYILNVRYETSISEFMNNISYGKYKEVYKQSGEEVIDYSSYIKTGYKLVLSNGEEYTLIVRGDINKDGKVSLTDLSKILLHYNGNIGFEIIDSYSLLAADMNFDGKVSLTDVSQLIVLYNSI